MSTEKILVTAEQISNLRHMIGFDWNRVRRGCYTAFRNCYAAHDLLPDMEQLCKLEICRRTEIDERRYVYYGITDKGAKLLGDLLGVEIVLRG